MVRLRDGKDLAGADMAGARSQQARAASVRTTGGISGSGFLRVYGSPVHPTHSLILSVHTTSDSGSNIALTSSSYFP